MKEICTTKAIVGYLNANGCAVWMNEITGMPSRSSPTGKRKLRGGRGSADIVGTIRGGRACFIECKKESERNRISTVWKSFEEQNRWPIKKYKYDAHVAEQCAFLLWQRKAGAFVMFAFSLADVENIFSEMVEKK